MTAYFVENHRCIFTRLVQCLVSRLASDKTFVHTLSTLPLVVRATTRTQKSMVLLFKFVPRGIDIFIF